MKTAVFVWLALCAVLYGWGWIQAIRDRKEHEAKKYARGGRAW